MVSKELTPELRVRIKSNLESRLNREEALKLREQLKEEFGYDYGSSLKDCRCPKCNEQLILTFAYGPACFGKGLVFCYIPKYNLIYLDKEAA